MNKLNALNILVILSYTKMKEYISQKILNYKTAKGITNQVLEPNLVQMHKRIAVDKYLE
jgi:hypothetical protein